MGGQHGHEPEHHHHSHGPGDGHHHHHGDHASGHHHHAHHHHGQDYHAHGQAGSAFRWSIVLNSGLTALQLAIGFGFGSLALIGDALHNLGDVVGLALGWGQTGSAAGRPAGASPTAMAAAPRWCRW